MKPRLPLFLHSLLVRRHGGVLLFLFLFVGVATATRIALLAKAFHSVGIEGALLAAFAWGLVYDVATGLLFALPLILLLALLPERFFEHISGRALAHIGMACALALFLFGAVSEWLFWDEFSVRFNFIAVDYLVYTTEVIGNIRESYPMPLIFAGIFATAALLYAGFVRLGLMSVWLESAREPARRRYLAGAAWLAVSALVALGVDSDELPAFSNNYTRELAKNGVWSLFDAFKNNELSYDEFYATLPIDDAFKHLHTELAQDGSTPLTDNPRDTLRLIRNPGPELRPNVIQITVESLSADFLSTFNHASHLTPNLEEIARKSLVFDQLYATGTRTDRGMEALTLAVPPTPGRSLIKRENNENLFTLGSVFRSRNYTTAFLYGGYGYFDNMNYFFGHNGYRIVDRASVAKNDITFANAWGACDEDLFRWTLREADAAAATQQPFFYFVMTTSNHRPYTFPEGRIDLPSKISGRAGAVKYTDYAIGKFLRDAESHPWFKNTIFVIVADHCASVAGKTELPVQNYHIPLFIYAPGGQIAPGHVSALMSQVDYAPTLLGLLKWTYASRFYGWDVTRPNAPQRALIGNYQRLGLYTGGELSVLRPLRGVNRYRYDPSAFSLTPLPSDEPLRDKNISYYQTASYLYRNHGYNELTPAEQNKASQRSP
jgi:phosphoglycerol transferase MdoB-like AlkP superfamily enzyme